jgi:predicted TPR repeat methyltransferase
MTANYFDQAAANWDEQPVRVRLMKMVGEAIVREAAPTRDMKILGYGCGTGLLGLYLLPYVSSVTGADNSAGWRSSGRSSPKGV